MCKSSAVFNNVLFFSNATITRGLAITGTDAQKRKDSVKSEVDNWINNLNIVK